MLDLYRFQQTKPPPGAQIDLSHPLSQGLVAAWLFNEGAGGSAWPSAPLDTDGTVLTLGSPPTNTAWSYGGLTAKVTSTAILTAATPRRFRTFTQMSCVARGKFSATPNFGALLECRGTTDTYWAVLATSSNTLTNAWANSASTYSGTTAATIPLNTPNTFLGGSSNKNKFLGYCNGKYGTNDYSGSLLRTTLTWDAALTLCRDSGGGSRTILGTYDFIYFWINRLLTVDDFRSLEANPYQMFLPTNPNRSWFLPNTANRRRRVLIAGKK